MPTVDENLASWGRDYGWPSEGDEWSAPWGGSEVQWRFSLLPRLHQYLPATNILEIAPGFGRWTQYLANQCERLTVVDLSEKCIAACKRRFAGNSRINYFVNDGKDLSMLPERTFDLVFSFDSLVHAEADVFESYLPQLAKVLTPDGVGFIHHSNSGNYRALLSLSINFQVPVLAGLLKKLKITEANTHWRALSMTGERFEEIAARANLACISQELVDWQTRKGLLIDCFSTFTPRGSKFERPNRRYANASFMQEVRKIKALAELYGRK
jgi:ubiquinone/menaquinone biosynthesis C-methylase UbiE